MSLIRKLMLPALTAGSAVALSQPAFAHVGIAPAGGAAGFGSGFAHPFSGFDHLLAMIAVGLWALQLSARGERRALWLLPLAFVLPMAAGFALGFVGLALPGVELGIAVSLLAFGLLVALAAQPPLWLALLCTAAAAVFHGHAHGTELPVAAQAGMMQAARYAAGMLAATALLHAGGITVAALAQRLARPQLVRLAGAGIAVLGIFVLVH
ncbi:MAG TPA: HupE/UreJ family protein [Ferrovibrio sp.]|uniref:HupE/UreJ family protein n=1 Tax=Ferrovibrio sp. TaxID=1917215 RepID=UPI002ED256F3